MGVRGRLSEQTWRKSSHGLLPGRCKDSEETLLPKYKKLNWLIKRLMFHAVLVSTSWRQFWKPCYKSKHKTGSWSFSTFSLRSCSWQCSLCMCVCLIVVPFRHTALLPTSSPIVWGKVLYKYYKMLQDRQSTGEPTLWEGVICNFPGTC